MLWTYLASIIAVPHFILEAFQHRPFFLENQYEFYVFWDISTAWSNFTFIDMAYFSQFPYSYTLMLSYLKKPERIHVNTLTHQIPDNYYKNVFWYSVL